MVEEKFEMELDRDSGLVSIGTHLLKIVSVSESMGGSGYPNWAFDCVVQTPGEDQGLHVRMNVSHSPQAAWKRNEFLDSLGAPTKGKAVSAQFIGKLFRGVIEHELYKEKMQAVVKTMLPVETQSVQQATLPFQEGPATHASSIPVDVVKPKKTPF